MAEPTHVDARDRPVRARGGIWQVPTTLWVYGALRSLAFAAPAWSEGGQIGLGAAVTAGLFVFVVRGSARAWKTLVFLDCLSLAMLWIAWVDAGDAALIIPVLPALALGVLVSRPTRRYALAS